MPKRLENALKASALRQGITPGSERWKQYVYGTVAKVEREKRTPEPGEGQEHKTGGNDGGAKEPGGATK